MQSGDEPIQDQSERATKVYLESIASFLELEKATLWAFQQ